MFDYSRVKKSASWYSLLMLALYFPLGVLLVPVRVLLTVVMGLISALQCTSFCLPRKLHTVLLRVQLLIFFGVWIEIRGKPAADTPLWVANHISEFDAIVLRAIADPYILGYHFYRDIWWLKLSPIRIFKMIYVPQQSRSEGNGSARDEINRVIRSTLQSPGEVLLLFPEGGLTNGRVGLLQYHKFVFGLDMRVQPIALSLASPLPLHVDTMYASFLSNVLCFMFVPFQCYTVDFLPPAAIDAELQESPLEFSRRVMTLTAAHLNIKVSPFLYSDKKKWGLLRRGLAGDGFKLDIVVDEASSSVAVVDTASKKKARHKGNAVQPEEGGDSARELLLGRLYEAWQMTHASFSHLCFVRVAPAVDDTPFR